MGFLYTIRKILTRSNLEQYESKLSQDESNNLHVMQQPTMKSLTTCSTFRNSYLIHVLLKSNVISNLENIDKISTWNKYNLSKLKV